LRQFTFFSRNSDSFSLQNAIKIVPDYIATLPALATCNLEGNPIEQLATSMTFTLTRFNLRSASEMVTESWRHQEQVNAIIPIVQSIRLPLIRVSMMSV
jgi:hypothetical protein